MPVCINSNEANREWKVLRKQIVHDSHKSGECVKQSFLCPISRIMTVTHKNEGSEKFRSCAVNDYYYNPNAED